MPDRMAARCGFTALTSPSTPPRSYQNHEPTRPRRLLLHKKQIRQWSRATTERGLTIVPLNLYLKNGMAKVELGLGRGKKQYDKRQAIAKRDADRDMQRALRHSGR